MCRKEPGMKINRVTLYNFSSYVGENNFAVAKGLVAHLCPEINNGSDLLKRMNEYADSGIAILRTDYENSDEDFDPSAYLE